MGRAPSRETVARPRRIAVFGHANLEIVIPVGLPAGDCGAAGGPGERLILSDYRDNAPGQHDPAQAARLAGGCDLAASPGLAAPVSE